MVLKDTVATMGKLLSEMARDLEKSHGGNKAASQRVRTASVQFAKVAKVYRKESVAKAKKGAPLSMRNR